MSNVEVKRLYDGTYVHADAYPNGKPLGRPIRIKVAQSYLTPEQARACLDELQAALEVVSKAE